MGAEALPGAVAEHREELVAALGVVSTGLSLLPGLLGLIPEPTAEEAQPSELADAFSSTFRSGLAEYENAMLGYIAEYEAMVRGQQERLNAEVEEAKRILLGEQKAEAGGPPRDERGRFRSTKAEA